MKLLATIPYLFDGTIEYAENFHSRLFVNPNERGGIPYIEFRYTRTGALMEDELQMLMDEDVNDNDWTVKRTLPNGHVDLEYYKTFPLLENIEKLFNGELERYTFANLLGYVDLVVRDVKGTKMLLQVFGDGTSIPYVIQMPDLNPKMFY